MARTKKADPAKDADKKDKAAPKGTETAEQATDATQETEAAEQTQDATQETETAEQTEDAPQEQEAAEQEEDPVQEPQETPQDAPEPEEDTTTGDGDAPQGTQDEPERDLFAGIPNPCVYCGPTVRGVARQYTTYQGGGIPDALRDFIKEHPEARRLIVSTAQFPNLRKRLDTPGTAEAKLYKQVKGQL